MNKSYEPLSKHIQPIDTRNTDMVTERLLGINIDKYFMPSVANVIGTDLSRYKLISKGLFACNTMHVGRDERLPVALYEEDEPAIVSPAYTMFKITDENCMLPEYLMMWFKRTEFDRICWLKTDGSVRGGISWDDIGRLELPVPSLDKQKSVVKAYKTITDRITLKRAINDNLEATVMALYKDKFLCENPLPDGWCIGKFTDIADVVMGQSPSGEDCNNDNNGEPLLNGPTEFSDYYPTAIQWTTAGNKRCQPGDILFCVRGSTTGRMNWADREYIIGRGLAAIRHKKDISLNWFIKSTLDEHLPTLLAAATGSTFPNIGKDLLNGFTVVIPATAALLEFGAKGSAIRIQITCNAEEIAKLTQLTSILMSDL